MVSDDIHRRDRSVSLANQRKRRCMMTPFPTPTSLHSNICPRDLVSDALKWDEIEDPNQIVDHDLLIFD